MVKQEDFNAYFGRQLKQNAYLIEHLGDYMSRVKGELKLISNCLLYTSPSPRDGLLSRMPSSA